MAVCALFFNSPVLARNEDPMGVREFMDRSSPGTDASTVEGVVSQISPDRELLSLIDVAEFRECKVVTCAKLTLPVRWRGEPPAVASIVRVTGTVQEEGVRRLFSASSLTVVEPPPGESR
jgi:hypothetical protein